MGTSWADWPASLSGCLLAAISYTGNMLIQVEGAGNGFLRVIRHENKNFLSVTYTILLSVVYF